MNERSQKNLQNQYTLNPTYPPRAVSEQPRAQTLGVRGVQNPGLGAGGDGLLPQSPPCSISRRIRLSLGDAAAFQGRYKLVWTSRHGLRYFSVHGSAISAHHRLGPLALSTCPSARMLPRIYVRAAPALACVARAPAGAWIAAPPGRLRPPDSTAPRM